VRSRSFIGLNDSPFATKSSPESWLDRFGMTRQVPSPLHDGGHVAYTMKASLGGTTYDCKFYNRFLSPPCFRAAALAAGFKSFEWVPVLPPSADAIAALDAAGAASSGGCSAGTAADWREFCTADVCPIISFIAIK